MQRDSDHELKLLDNILHGVAADYTTDKPLTGFLAMIGDKYTGELMVAGRAVNGWADALTARDLGDETARSTVTREIYRSVSSGPCPMLWVTNQWRVEKGKYSTARSQFWRVVRNIVGELRIGAIDQADWPSHLVWSNLYKVSLSRGGNPGVKLRRAQFAGCLDLLKWELDNYRPRRVLFLTDSNWAEPFLKQLWVRNCKPSSESLVDNFGTIKSGSGLAACVVAKHPQSMNESQWARDTLDALDELDRW